MPGDFGKPRPALIIQSDLFEHVATVTVLLITGSLADAPLLRPSVHPTAKNGLMKVSQVQIDKAMTVNRHRIGAVIGRLDDETLLAVTRSLALFLGLA
jgi:mRNA interferase MazF